MFITLGDPMPIEGIEFPPPIGRLSMVPMPIMGMEGLTGDRMFEAIPAFADMLNPPVMLLSEGIPAELTFCGGSPVISDGRPAKGASIGNPEPEVAHTHAKVS